MMVINRLITNSHVVAAGLFAGINSAMKKKIKYEEYERWLICESE